jgi:hypothetical protein
MNTTTTKKLTLALDGHVLSRAKQYSRSKNISLSKMVESYFGLLTEEQKEDEINEITPFVAKLKAGFTLPADFDYKADIADYLDKKYE